MLTTRDLTPGERLVVDRRRRGETKAKAAKRHGVTLYRYGSWESDLGGFCLRVSIGRLQVFEALHALRRRAGVSVADLAEALDVSAWWLTQIEAGKAPADRALDFWGRCLRGSSTPCDVCRAKVARKARRMGVAPRKRSRRV